MQVRFLSPTPSLLFFCNKKKKCLTFSVGVIYLHSFFKNLSLYCSVRLSARTPPFHGGKEGFDSPTEYHIKLHWVTNSSRWLSRKNLSSRADLGQYHMKPSEGAGISWTVMWTQAYRRTKPWEVSWIRETLVTPQCNSIWYHLFSVIKVSS